MGFMSTRIEVRVGAGREFFSSEVAKNGMGFGFGVAWEGHCQHAGAGHVSIGGRSEMRRWQWRVQVRGEGVAVHLK